jgi:hypothetical protein
MKTTKLLIAILFVCQFAQSATTEWLKSYGSLDHERYSFSAKDADGNLYVATPIAATTDFNPNPYATAIVSINNADVNAIAISKFDANGNFLWVKSLTSQSFLVVTAFSIDLNGNIYFGGYFSTNYAGTYHTEFNPDPIKQALLLPTPYIFKDDAGNSQTRYFEDGFVCKWDKEGNFVWVKQFKGTINEEVTQLVIDNATNSLYVSGMFWGGYGQAEVDANPDENAEAKMYELSDYNAAFITKLDLDGNYVWSAQLDGNKGCILGRSGMGVDDAHNLYVAGMAMNHIDANPGAEVTKIPEPTVPINSTGVLFILKWDANKNLIWAKSFANVNADKLHGAMSVDKKTGDVYIAGEYGGTIQFAKDAEILYSNGVWDAYLAKFSTNGDYIWSKSWGGSAQDESLALVVDDLNNVFVAGKFQNRVDFDPGVGQNFSSSKGQLDAFISIFKSNGEYVTTKTVGSMGHDWPYSLTALGDGGLFATGAFSFTATSGVSSVDAVGGYDIWMLKIDGTKTSINETRLDANISLFPNPTQGQTVINLNKEFSEITVTVRNLLGAEISRNSYRNVRKINLNLQCESGLYLIELQDKDGKRKTIKLLKND